MFNLIPFPPLDGSKIVASILPSSMYDTWMYLERYGFLILMVLLMLGIFDPILTTSMGFVQNMILMTVGIV